MGEKSCVAKCCRTFMVGIVSRIYLSDLREQNCKSLGREEDKSW